MIKKRINQSINRYQEENITTTIIIIIITTAIAIATISTVRTE